MPVRKPLRVAIDVRPLAEGPSGVATYLRNLVPALLALKSPHEFFLAWTGAHRPAGLAGPGWQPLPIAQAPEVVWEHLLLPAALRARRIDVFHRASGAGGLLLRWMGRPRVVVTVHDLVPLMFPGYFRNAAHQVFFKFQLALSRRADAIITVSEASKRDLIAVGRIPPDRVDVVLEAADRELQSRSADPGDLPAWLADRLPYLLTMGAAEPRKNVATVVAAFAEIANRIPHHLLVVGGAWRGRTLAVDTRVRGRVHQLGVVGNRDLKALYGAADVFIYPSLYEGFGLPVLEAMACRTPVITSREGSLPEVAGDAALYVDPRDPSAIARAVMELLADPDRRSHLVAAGRRRVETFSWERAARQTLEVYERAAGFEGG